MLNLLYGGWDTTPARTLIDRLKGAAPDSYLWFVPTGALSRLRTSQGLQVKRTDLFLASREQISRELNIRQSALQKASVHRIREQLARSGPLDRAAARRSFTDALYDAFHRFHLSLLSAEEVASALDEASPDTLALAAPYGEYLRRVGSRPGWGGAGVRAVTELRQQTSLPGWMGSPAVAVFEGYTYLSPVQEELIRHLDRCGVEVYLIITYDPRHQVLFAAAEATYERLVPRHAWQKTGSAAPERNGDLLAICTNLFAADAAGRTGPADLSLEVHRFLTDEQELNAVIKSIEALIKGGIKPADIAIIARTPAQHELALSRIAADHAVPLDLPEPALAQTPVGDLIRRMYDLEGVRFTYQTLSMLFSSGWVGDGNQGTLLARLRYYLASLHRWEQIDAVLEKLEQVPTADVPPYHPLGAAGVGGLARLRVTIRSLYHWTINGLAPGERTLSEHVSVLRQSLADLGTWRRLEALPRVRDRLQALLRAAEGGERLTGPEFALYIRTMLSDWDRPDMGSVLDTGRVAVVSPEQAEGVTFRAVFIIGCVAAAFPKPMPEAWPFTAGTLARLAKVRRVHQLPERNTHLDLERYWFAVTATRATERLWVSYATGEERDPQITSPFLWDLLAAVGRTETSVIRHGLTPWFDKDRAPVTPEGNLGLVIEQNRWAEAELTDPERNLRDWVEARERAEAEPLSALPPPEELTGTDLFILKVCPYRFHLERNLQMVEPFFHRFHLEHLARTQWLQAMTRQCANWGSDRGTARQEIEPAIRALYGALGEASWQNIVRGVKRLEGDWLAVEPRVHERYKVTVQGIQVTLDGEAVSASFTAPDRAALAFPAPATVKRITAARDWYRELVEMIIDAETDPEQVADYVRPVLESVLQGNYRRVRDEDGHCSYCPHRVSCFMSSVQEGKVRATDTDPASAAGH